MSRRNFMLKKRTMLFYFHIMYNNSEYRRLKICIKTPNSSNGKKKPIDMGLLSENLVIRQTILSYQYIFIVIKVDKMMRYIRAV